MYTYHEPRPGLGQSVTQNEVGPDLGAHIEAQTMFWGMLPISSNSNGGSVFSLQLRFSADISWTAFITSLSPAILPKEPLTGFKCHHPFSLTPCCLWDRTHHLSEINYAELKGRALSCLSKTKPMVFLSPELTVHFSRDVKGCWHFRLQVGSLPACQTCKPQPGMSQLSIVLGMQIVNVLINEGCFNSRIPPFLLFRLYWQTQDTIFINERSGC